MKGLSFGRLATVVAWLHCILLLGCESEPQKAALRGESAYMLAVAPGQTRAAVYLNLINDGEHDRSINLVSSNIAGYGEVHSHEHKNGVMSMRKVQHPKARAHSTLKFTPGGYHIMLLDLAEPPAVGNRVELVLAFDEGETLAIDVEVRPVH